LLDIALGTHLSIGASTLSTDATGTGILATKGDIGVALPSLTTSQLYGGAGTAGVAQAFPLGANVSAALQQALNGASGLVGYGGALGTPTSGVGTNITGLLATHGLYTHSGTSAIQEAVNSKLDQTISIADFGAVCDGTTDDTAAIQAAWNAGAAQNKNVKLSGVGAICKISSLTMPSPTTGYSLLVGDGPKTVALYSTVAGTTCAITVSASYGVNSSIYGTMGGFALVQNAGTHIGYGICLNQLTAFNLDGLLVTGFARGISAVDVIDLNVTRPYLFSNGYNIYGTIASYSNPNNWTIANGIFAYADTNTIYLVGPATIDIKGNDIEFNGVVPSATYSTIYINGNPVDGQTGVTVEDNYFESNQGLAEVYITDPGTTYNGVHDVRSNLFHRNYNALTNQVFVNNAASGSFITQVDVKNNALTDFGAYTPSSSRQHLTLANPTATSTGAVACEGNYIDQQATEQTAISCPNGGAIAAPAFVDSGMAAAGMVCNNAAGMFSTSAAGCTGVVENVAVGGNQSAKGALSIVGCVIPDTAGSSTNWCAWKASNTSTVAAFFDTVAVTYNSSCSTTYPIIEIWDVTQGTAAGATTAPNAGINTTSVNASLTSALATDEYAFRVTTAGSGCGATLATEFLNVTASVRQ
jgi:hypothetical protein